jgi:hypothetical protein
MLSWLTYYLGCAAYEILDLFDNEMWVNIWFPFYSNLLIWSHNIQNYAGFDPVKVQNTDGWPWYSPNIEKE